MLGIYHTTALLEALADLHHIHDESSLFHYVLNRGSEILRAQGGTFYSVREDVGELKPEASKGVSIDLLKEIPFKLRTGVCGWVASNRRPAVIDNAQNDDRFNRAVDVITGVRTRSILCVPIIQDEKILGVVEFINRVDGTFNDKDLDFLKNFTNQVGVALDNCRLYKSTQNLLAYTNSVINSLTGGFISTDTEGNITQCNDAACRILGLKKEDVANQSLSKALPQYPAFSAILDVTQKHETPVARQEIELRKSDGTSMIIGYSTFLIHDSDDKFFGAGIVFQNLTNLKR